MRLPPAMHEYPAPGRQTRHGKQPLACLTGVFCLHCQYVRPGCLSCRRPSHSCMPGHAEQDTQHMEHCCMILACASGDV